VVVVQVAVRFPDAALCAAPSGRADRSLRRLTSDDVEHVNVVADRLVTGDLRPQCLGNQLLELHLDTDDTYDTDDTGDPLAPIKT
jgi:hypothetical protein